MRFGFVEGWYMDSFSNLFKTDCAARHLLRSAPAPAHIQGSPVLGFLDQVGQLWFFFIRTTCSFQLLARAAALVTSPGRPHLLGSVLWATNTLQPSQPGRKSGLGQCPRIFAFLDFCGAASRSSAFVLFFRSGRFGFLLTRFPC